eukprot:gene6658-3322_t
MWCQVASVGVYLGVSALLVAQLSFLADIVADKAATAAGRTAFDGGNYGFTWQARAPIWTMDPGVVKNVVTGLREVLAVDSIHADGSWLLALLKPCWGPVPTTTPIKKAA